MSGGDQVRRRKSFILVMTRKQGWLAVSTKYRDIFKEDANSQNRTKFSRPISIEKKTEVTRLTVFDCTFY